MKIWLLPLFIIAEFYATSKMISLIGFGWMMVWFLVAFVIGVFTLKSSQFLITANISQLFANPNNIKNIYSSGIYFVVGAILLLIPGVLSDLIGVLSIAYSLYLQTFGTITTQTTKQKQKDSDVIDAEIIDSNTISNNSDSKHSM